ncbi:hypothetical protein HK405_013860, partial [Cladochytrium tenue]
FAMSVAPPNLPQSSSASSSPDSWPAGLAGFRFDSAEFGLGDEPPLPANFADHSAPLNRQAVYLGPNTSAVADFRRASLAAVPTPGRLLPPSQPLRHQLTQPAPSQTGLAWNDLATGHAAAQDLLWDDFVASELRSMSLDRPATRPAPSRLLPDWPAGLSEHAESTAWLAKSRGATAVTASRGPMPFHPSPAASTVIAAGTKAGLMPLHPSAADAFDALSSRNAYSSTGAPGSSGAPPPPGYLCKLCLVGGHWMKSCRLYRERRRTSPLMSAAQLDGDFGFGEYIAPSAAQMHSQFHLGHRQSLQPQTHQRPQSNVPTSRTSLPPSYPPSGYVCHRCGVPGHWIQLCPHADFANSDGRRVVPTMSPSARYPSMAPLPHEMSMRQVTGVSRPGVQTFPGGGFVSTQRQAPETDLLLQKQRQLMHLQQQLQRHEDMASFATGDRFNVQSHIQPMASVPTSSPPSS